MKMLITDILHEIHEVHCIFDKSYVKTFTEKLQMLAKIFGEQNHIFLRKLGNF